MEAEKKSYTHEEIQKMAPRYRGKPENFKPDAVGKTRRPPPKKQQERRKQGPSTSEVPAPKLVDKNTNPTPQRNESIVSEAIFGVDVSVTAIEPRQNFLANYSQLPQLARDVFAAYAPDVKNLDRQMIEPEMVYYATALLWIRLIDIKAKQGRVTLTTEEKEIRKICMDTVFNVPQPLYAYLSQIGNVRDKGGKETELEIPNLPVSVAQNMGGYHSTDIDLDSHNLYEEVPTLGIAADVLMAAASNQDAPNVNVRVAIPDRSVITTNLLCYTTLTGRRDEIKRALASEGITVDAFPEYIPNTRFNHKYLLSISDRLGKFETFRIEKLVVSNLTIQGGETQIIQTMPIVTEDGNMPWINRSVVPSSAACDSTAQIGASYVFGFQLSKENGTGNSDTTRSRNWCCLTSAAGANAWVVPAAWVANKNARRNLPPGIGTFRFRGIGKRQDVTRQEVVRRMVKTPR